MPDLNAVIVLSQTNRHEECGVLLPDVHDPERATRAPPR